MNNKPQNRPSYMSSADVAKIVDSFDGGTLEARLKAVEAEIDVTARQIRRWYFGEWNVSEFSAIKLADLAKRRKIKVAAVGPVGGAKPKAKAKPKPKTKTKPKAKAKAKPKAKAKAKAKAKPTAA